MRAKSSAAPGRRRRSSVPRCGARLRATAYPGKTAQPALTGGTAASPLLLHLGSEEVEALLALDLQHERITRLQRPQGAAKRLDGLDGRAVDLVDHVPDLEARFDAGGVQRARSDDHTGPAAQPHQSRQLAADGD